MNVQKLFLALKEDNQNSALGIICGELEAQGYTVKLDGKEVTSDEVYEGKYADFEETMEPLNVALYRKEILEQEFAIEFIDYHEIAIKPKVG